MTDTGRMDRQTDTAQRAGIAWQKPRQHIMQWIVKYTNINVFIQVVFGIVTKLVNMIF